MMKTKLIIGTIAILLSINVSAANFQEGKDFETIPSSKLVQKNHKNEVVIYEFFSYGCPWCYKIEPKIKTWSKTKPANVRFERVPVTFHRGWDKLAKAYFVAEALDVENKVSPAIFAAIHDENKNVANESDLKKLFVAQGVKADDFDSAYYFSPGIDAQLNKGDELMVAFQVRSIPTVVVGDKYKLNTRMVDGDIDKFIDVLDFLVKKSQGKKI